MQLLKKATVILLALVTAFPALGQAQMRHVVDPAALGEALDEHLMKQDADRAAIREALARHEVREAVSRAGLDVDRLARSVETMSGVALEEAGGLARDVNQGLVGGQSTIVISTTTVLIVLLVVIILLALD